MSKQFLVSFFLFLILASFLAFGKKVENSFYGLIEKPSFYLSQIGEETFSLLNVFGNVKKVKKENEALRKENRKLKQEIASLLPLRKENKSLREMLNLEDRRGYQFVFAKVIARNVPEDLILINKGADELKEGMVVVDEEENLVGKVVEVFDNYSQVKLITAEGEMTAVYFGEKEVTAETEGQGSLSLLLTLVPPEEEIRKKDMVFTAGLNKNMPAGVLVGEIKEVVKSDVKAYKEAKIRSAAPLQELMFVFVVTDY